VLVMGQGNLNAQAGGKGFGAKAAQYANEAARRMAPTDIDNLLSEGERGDAETIIASLGRLFLQGQLTDNHRQILRDYLGTRPKIEDDDIRHAIRLLMCTTEYQVT
jgi:hypothetical protein